MDEGTMSDEEMRSYTRAPETTGVLLTVQKTDRSVLVEEEWELTSDGQWELRDSTRLASGY